MLLRCATVVSVGLPSRYKVITTAGLSSVASITKSLSGTLYDPLVIIHLTLPVALPPEEFQETIWPTRTESALKISPKRSVFV